MPETFKAKHMQEEVWAGFEKKVPRWHHGHVRRENRLLRPAGLREHKDTRQRHRSIVSVASTSKIGPVERAPGRRATAMVEDGIVKDFAVLSRVRVAAGRVESSQSRVAKSVPGCKGTRYFATFCATVNFADHRNSGRMGLVHFLLNFGRRCTVRVERVVPSERPSLFESSDSFWVFSFLHVSLSVIRDRASF